MIQSSGEVTKADMEGILYVAEIFFNNVSPQASPVEDACKSFLAEIRKIAASTPSKGSETNATQS